MLHFIDSLSLFEKWDFNSYVIRLHVTLLSSLGAVRDSLQLEKKGGSPQMACPFSVSDNFLEWDALPLSTS